MNFYCVEEWKDESKVFFEGGLVFLGLCYYYNWMIFFRGKDVGWFLFLSKIEILFINMFWFNNY